MTDHGHRQLRQIGAIGDLGTFFEHHLRVVGQQADQLFAVWPRRVGARQGSLAQAILGLGHHGTQAQIDGRHRAIGILADDDVTFFGAQHVHGFGAVGRDAKFGARRVDGFPNL